MFKIGEIISKIVNGRKYFYSAIDSEIMEKIISKYILTKKINFIQNPDQLKFSLITGVTVEEVTCDLITKTFINIHSAVSFNVITIDFNKTLKSNDFFKKSYDKFKDCGYFEDLIFPETRLYEIYQNNEKILNYFSKSIKIENKKYLTNQSKYEIPYAIFLATLETIRDKVKF